MLFKDMDPSCALGFLLSNNNDLDQFVEYLTKTGISSSISGTSDTSLFSIISERPFFDSSLLSSPKHDEETGFELM